MPTPIQPSRPALPSLSARVDGSGPVGGSTPGAARGSVDGFNSPLPAAPAAPVSLPPEAKALAAVRKMREVIQAGRLAEYYQAAIDLGDPSLKEEALKLFSELPKVTSSTTADDLVAWGYWSQKPQGLQEMETSARFLPGRQVLVEAPVVSNVFDPNFLSYQEDGTLARTYRATLVGESGGDFLVKVDGRQEPLTVPQERLFALNQPHVYSGDVLKPGYKTGDYASPFVKAKLAEALIKMDPLVSQLDFTRTHVREPRRGLARLFGGEMQGEAMSEIQRKCVRVVHDVIDMKYPKGDVYKLPGRYSGPDAGRQAVCGIGMCFEQASVMLTLLNPLRDKLGVDVQFISGGTYRDVKSPTERPFRGGAHGWLQLTYRPSMELRICDRTWSQPDQPADRAYSRFGDRYPAGHNSNAVVAPPSDTDVKMSGDATVATFERQFGVQGEDGREHHMSLTPS